MFLVLKQSFLAIFEAILVILGRKYALDKLVPYLESLSVLLLMKISVFGMLEISEIMWMVPHSEALCGGEIPIKYFKSLHFLKM